MKQRNKTQPLDANLKDVAPTLVLYLIGVILVILALGTLTTWVDAKFSNPQTMTTIEHLQRIKSRCQELLTTAETRTPGGWAFDPENIGGGSWPYYGLINAESGESVPVHVLIERPGNATFIASCAGPAEAGWRATIAAVDSVLGCPCCGGSGVTKGWVPSYNDPDNASMAPEAEPCCGVVAAIIAAWPEEVLA